MEEELEFTCKIFHNNVSGHTFSHLNTSSIYHIKWKKFLTSIVPYVDEIMMRCVNCLHNTTCKCIYFCTSVYIFAFCILFTRILNSISHSVSNCNIALVQVKVKFCKLIIFVIMFKQLILISLTLDN